MSAGRPPRVLIAKPGLDGHDVGAKVLCRALMDAGMEVLYTGLRQSPEDIARTAVDEGVDLVGLSILSGAHLPLTRKVLRALAAAGAGTLPVAVGGNVPRGDCEALRDLGAAVALPTGTPLAEIVETLGREARR